ncbi:MAG: winged helix-turn-helix domain-containing protein, partial [Acidimicrobiia bacterium]|nr:winged helix-turn-helix domain-containing protein [Acidimicrobiia bacterium]
MSAAEARRVALAAQGFADRRLPLGARLDRRHVRRVFERVALVQLDSVNVVVRSHELPFYARLGGHDHDLVRAMQASGELFEYWGHEASLLPVELHPLLRWRMARAEAGETWGGLARLGKEHPGYVEAVAAEVAARGPLTASQLSDPGGRTGPWWGWNRGKQALELLFRCGRLVPTRTATFERRYDLPERALPADVLAQPTPPDTDAHRELLAISARALGVGTERDLADYFRLNLREVRPRLSELVEDGRLLPVAVEGWGPAPTYLDPAAPPPRGLRARSLVSPFDSLVWARARAERIWGFRYRLEFYTPAERREFGYFVLPFLLGESLVARVDLKADRRAGVLRALGAFPEPGRRPALLAPPLASELVRLCAWLGLGRVEVHQRGAL